MQSIMIFGRALLDAAFFAVLAFGPSAFAGPIFLDSSGREWLDVNDIRFTSWNKLASVCNSTDGTCIGSIDTWRGTGWISEDITGYTWASQEDVRGLFYEISGLPQGTLDSGAASVANQYGVTALNVFPPTFESSNGYFRILDGLTRSTIGTSEEDLAAIRGVISYYPNADAHFSVADRAGSLDSSTIEIGTYLFRPVPEPGSIGLVGTGLVLAVLWFRRRRTTEAVRCGDPSEA
jgi:hypothetical protein